MILFSYLCSPKIKKQSGQIMSNKIINQNADEQEVAQAPAATTKSPVEDTMEERSNNESKPSVNALTENEEARQHVTELKKNDAEESAIPPSHEAQEAPANGEPGQTQTRTHDAVPASPHDDFDWSVDKRNVTTYDKKEREKYDEVYDKTFKQINDNEMINGTVVGMTKTDVVINIGFKSDGL